MMKKVLDKVEDLVMFKAKPTPEQQVKELDEQIEDLKKKRQIVLDGVDKKYVSKMLSRIMGQWVIVGGWSDDDEHPFHGQHYTIYKVVKALQWEGGNSFRIIAKHMMYLSAEGYLNGGIYEVDVNRRVNYPPPKGGWASCLAIITESCLGAIGLHFGRGLCSGEACSRHSARLWVLVQTT